MQVNPFPSNPFVGLRPFESNESIFFFGRGAQTGELLERLYTCSFFSVVGRSGCGKSSLMRLISGLHPPLAGSLTVEGKAVTGPLKSVRYPKPPASWQG